jgi:hypothetical protein
MALLDLPIIASQVQQGAAKLSDVSNSLINSAGQSVTTATTAIGSALSGTAIDADTVTSGDTIPVESNQSTTEVNDTLPPTPRANPLHAYATYTYGITLFLLSAAEFNTIADLDNADAAQAWVPGKGSALISSAGNYTGDDRNSEFHEDFYFDNLRMQTAIGLNASGRGSNSIEIGFTIIEPYGMSLLDRMMEASRLVGGYNYLKQPYLMQIDFYGSTDLGDTQVPIPELRKRIPIQFLEFKISPSVKGTEYRVNAIPFNHGAMLESMNVTPANFSVHASTVGGFFDSSDAGLGDQISVKNAARIDVNLARERAAANFTEYPDAISRKSRPTVAENARTAAAVAVIAAPYVALNYGGAWNAWNLDNVTDKLVEYPNTIRFLVDPGISVTAIVTPEKNPVARTAFATNSKSAQQGNNPDLNSKNPSNDFSKQAAVFNISAGTSVVDVINLVMRNSTYLTNQIINAGTKTEALPLNQLVQWFKIIPKVHLGQFDVKRNEYVKDITFTIKRYDYFNSKVYSLPKKQPTGAVKEYNYIYTGKNIDILEFQVDFDTAFYTSIIANRNASEATQAATPVNGNGSLADPTSVPPGGAGTVTPATMQVKSGDTSVTSTTADTAPVVQLAVAAKSVYTSSRGDMLNIKLKIVGDPHFIKQDDLYLNQGGSQVMLNQGTLSMDNGDIFCTITFKSPVDYDETTGLMRNDKYASTGFSGYYKVMLVSSEFSRGQFVQTLDCIRVFDPTPVTTTISPERNTAITSGLTAVQAAQARTDFAAVDPRLIGAPDIQLKLPAIPSLASAEMLNTAAALPGVPSIVGPLSSPQGGAGQLAEVTRAFSGLDLNGAPVVDITKYLGGR